MNDLFKKRCKRIVFLAILLLTLSVTIFAQSALSFSVSPLYSMPIGTDLYIGGWEGSNGYYWIYTNEGSGTLTKHAITGYDNDYNGKVHDIYVNSDEDVYLVGEHYSEPTSWNPNNSGQTYLDGGNGAAYGLCYYENGSDDFYVVGYIDITKDKAVLWVTPDVPTSSTPVDLTNGTTNNAGANAVVSY